ncbi:MAG: 23S rRNA (pseudouridine(1915)-N(3))-methyltransferase RlmH [Trueperaceae bacterium]|nr:23S rRNA (pseudouridine(1915)-N(3))-methyltransferase RlmH [Trueperaceae bacterium]
MRYQLVAIGRLRRGFYQSACEHYQKRLEPYAKFDLVELKESRAADSEMVRTQESEALLKAASGRLIVLDERGEQHRSQELAARISALELRGISQISLIVGGAEGLSDDLRRRADERWSLSQLTLPHELARLLLLEQLYRLETIRAQHPYHRE